MTRRRGKRALLFARGAAIATLGALATLAACSSSNASDDSSGSASSCGATLPRSCTTAPSYTETVAPLVKRTCAGCHSPGGVASSRDFTTYKGTASLETTELIDLYSCQMPPADAGAEAMLSLTDRETIMQWFVCGSPDDAADSGADAPDASEASDASTDAGSR